MLTKGVKASFVIRNYVKTQMFGATKAWKHK